MGIHAIEAAIQIAQDKGLDLILISPDSKPPVCKFGDYSKFRYNMLKNAQQSRKHQRQGQVKEIKLRPSTGENDYQVKLNNIIRFLKSKNKVRIVIRFRGREIAHRRLGLDFLKRLEEDAMKFGAMEKEPEIEGRSMVMILTPR